MAHAANTLIVDNRGKHPQNVSSPKGGNDKTFIVGDASHATTARRPLTLAGHGGAELSPTVLRRK